MSVAVDSMGQGDASTSARTIVVGGGLAGLATVVGLGLHGQSALLLESRPRWGGRATSIIDQTTGETIDNCQHVAMGCCTNFLHFCKTVGIADRFRREQTLWFIGPRGEQSRFEAGPWPAPFHLTGAFAGLKHLSWRDRWQLAWGLRALARARPQDDDRTTFAEWLASHGQSPRVCDRFWNVVLVSALSETLDRINVAAARKVFVDGFLAHREAWEVLIPKSPLGDLYGAAVQSWMDAHGVETQMSAGVQAVELNEGRVCGVVLRTGARIAAERVVLAVPSSVVGSLLPEPIQSRPEVTGLDGLEWAPISSAHFWLDREAIPLPHAAMVGYRSQWVFNRTRLQSLQADAQSGWSYQVVISASRDLAGENRDAVLDGILAELGRVWPEVHRATVLHRRLITEHRAAVSMLPGVERLRPAQRTTVPGLFLAGDYTRTGWPSTMEGAVRSGYLAAEAILEELGQRTNVVQPDLPASVWARWTMGI